MLKVITIAQQKGGAGKTTIAAHISVSLSQKGKRVAIIDIDPQKSLTHWYNLRENKFGEGYTGIRFISVSGWRIDSTIHNLQDDFDYVIIDAPPHTQTESKSAIRAADLVIVPMQLSPTDLWATETTIKFAKSEGKNTKILLNRFNPVSKIAKEIMGQINCEIMTSNVGNRVAFSSCFLNGTTVTESFPATQAADEIRQLTQEILLLLEENNLTSSNENKLEKNQKLEEV
jgi:chromosome partitioning protein